MITVDTPCYIDIVPEGDLSLEIPHYLPLRFPGRLITCLHILRNWPVALGFLLGVSPGVSSLASAQQDSPALHSPAVVLFPREAIFPKFFADGSAEQFSLAKDAMSRDIIGSIGGIQRLFQFAHSSGALIQIGAGATIYGSFIRSPGQLQVVTADFYVDIPLEIKFSEHFALRTGWGHYSAHLVDDGIEQLHLVSINYAKDYIPLFAAYTLSSIATQLYCGIRFDYFTIPERNAHSLLQFGIQGGDLPVWSLGHLYGAVDIKLRSEVNWGTTQSYQIGLKFMEQGTRGFRFAYTYRTGIDDRGQFYQNRLTVSLVGVYFDL
jgi:hypothetical protein